MIPESVSEWNRHSRSNPMQCRRLAPQKVERLERLEFLERHREGGCQREAAHDHPGLRGRTKSEPKGGCEIVTSRKPGRINGVPHQCSVNRSRRVNRWTRSTRGSLALLSRHFSSRAISVQDAQKAVRRSCRQGLFSCRLCCACHGPSGSACFQSLFAGVSTFRCVEPFLY